MSEAPVGSSGPSFVAGLVVGIVIVVAVAFAAMQDPNEIVPLVRRYDAASHGWVAWDGDRSSTHTASWTSAFDATHTIELGAPAALVDAATAERIPLTGDGHGVAVDAVALASGAHYAQIQRDDTLDCTIVRIDVSARTITPLPIPSGFVCSSEPSLLGAGDALVLSYGQDAWTFDGTSWQPLPPNPFDTDAAFEATPDGTLLATGDTFRTSSTWVISIVVALVIAVVLVVALTRTKRRGPAFGGLAVGLLVTPVLMGALFFWAMMQGGGPHGRPVRRGGRRVRPRPLRAMGVRALPRSWRALRDGLAWARDAAEEHASIAAFENLARDLATHGAPEALVARARAAASEEIEHRDACIAVASSLLGVTLGPPADSMGSHAPTPTLAQMALESIEDGWLGEGLAAERARREAARRDGALRDVLEKIAREEATHAQLGLDVARFALARGDGPPG